MTDETPDPPAHPLSGYTVVELSSGIAGGYCTKLLVDAGATVVKLESPDGDPLRRWSASGSDCDHPDQPLFRHLAAGKDSVVLDPGDPGTPAAVRRILARADAVVWSAGSSLAALPELEPARLAADYPHLVVSALSSFGLTGPWAGRPATEFTLQAWSGGIVGLGRGTEDRAPFHVGGRVGEWASGVYAAVALLVGRLGGRPGLFDVSQLEVAALTGTYYPATFKDILGRPRTIGRRLPLPGVSVAKDGLIGMACGTVQQRNDLYALVEHPEWSEDDALMSRPDEIGPVIAEWIASRTVDEVRELATAFRIPNAPVGNAALIPQWEQITTRGSLEPGADGTFVRPRPPFRLSSAPLRAAAPAPRLGEHTGAWTATKLGARPQDRAVDRPERPLQGLRVLDLTAYWAGPLCGQTLAILGAEVIHVESTKRPDGGRLVSGVPASADSWWERGAIHLGGNAAKKDLTVDFGTETGRQLLHELVKTCDVVVENFTPRVLDNAGLGYEALRELRSDLVMVRMSGFGVEGPWRDNPAFAYAIEDAAGLTWMTGYADANPAEPYSIGDPNAGIHAVFALLVALENRARSGAGALVDAAMIDAALNIAAEQFIEYSANGVLLTRDGNRGPVAAPQNLYQAAGADEFGRDDLWVALAVTDDTQWAALRRVLGDPKWAADPRLSTAAGRREQHDLIDAHLRPWFRARGVEEAVAALWAAGVPVAPVSLPHNQAHLEQVVARGFVEEIEHPVAGTYRQSTLPFRWPGAPDRLIQRHAPLMGEHNGELLAEIGVTAEQLVELEADGIIGRAPYGQG